MNLSTTLQAVARHAGHRPAVSSEGGILTYAQLDHQAACIAGALLGRHNLGPGARVGLAMENCPEFLPALYGIWRAGMAAIPINSKLHPREMAWILADAEARLCIASPKIADGLVPTGGDVANRPPPIIVTGTNDHMRLLTAEPVRNAFAMAESEAWLFYTSGTTGRPKGAMLTHRNLLFGCQSYYADIDFLGPEDTILHAAPLTHG